MGQIGRLQSIQNSTTPVSNMPPLGQPGNIQNLRSTSGTDDGPQVMSSQDGSYQKAGFVIRWAASVLDGLLISFPLLIISIPFYKGDSELMDVISGLVVVAYSVFAIATYQTTLGKNFFHLRVISTDGSKIGFGKAIIREFLGKILSSIVFSLGYLWVIWDKEKQGWHDKLARTYVIQTQELNKGRKMFAYMIVLILPIIAILGILVVAILIGINPLKQMEDAKEVREKVETRKLGTDCLTIVSDFNLSVCVNQQIRAYGNLSCFEKLKIPAYIIFDDGSHLQLIEWLPEWEEYCKKRIQIDGLLYECGELDSCAGVGIKDIKSISALN
jgi:uncharacterized RDD family membrane protein YckC